MSTWLRLKHVAGFISKHAQIGQPPRDPMELRTRTRAPGPNVEQPKDDSRHALAQLRDEIGACARGEAPLPNRAQLDSWLSLLDSDSGARRRPTTR